MRLSRLILLAVVVLGLGAFIFFFERHEPTTDEARDRVDKLFATLDQSKVKRVVVQNPQGVFEILKEKETWKLVKPLADEANAGAVTSLLGSLASLKAERTFKASEVKLADYGLASPSLQVSVTDEAGKTCTLKLGNDLPLGSQRAAMTDGSAVYIVNKVVASDVEKGLSGWRSDQLVQVAAGEVAALTITHSGQRVALSHTGNLWRLTDPVADLADRERAEGLLADLGGARIKEFVDTPPPLRELGLDPRGLDLTVVRRGENAAPIQLDFGTRRTKDGVEQIACKRGDRVLWVEAKGIEKATANLADWRARKLVAVESWDQDKLEIEAGGSKAVMERKDGEWKAGSTDLDFNTVNSRLVLLGELQVQAFDQPTPTGVARGRVKVVSSAGTESEATFFPGAVAGQALAVVKGRTGAMIVEETKVKELLADPAALVRPTPTAAPATPAPTPGTGVRTRGTTPPTPAVP